MIKNELINSIKNKSARVGVIGLGYVGLPLVTEFARGGFNGTGFEVDAEKAAKINAGESYIGDVESSQVKELIENGKLHATTNFDELRDCDAISICVPTPLRKRKTGPCRTSSPPPKKFRTSAAWTVNHSRSRRIRAPMSFAGRCWQERD